MLELSVLELSVMAEEETETRMSRADVVAIVEAAVDRALSARTGPTKNAGEY